ncbi:hypothetical protein M0R45_008469 [Rubus argutus]|uniref:Uncharacterized protein n=1 Tax=Rubus argutus TaxID=59490 RepID=A0AAW1Y2T5_RUBAR
MASLKFIYQQLCNHPLKFTTAMARALLQSQLSVTIRSFNPSQIHQLKSIMAAALPQTFHQSMPTPLNHRAFQITTVTFSIIHPPPSHPVQANPCNHQPNFTIIHQPANQHSKLDVELIFHRQIHRRARAKVSSLSSPTPRPLGTHRCRPLLPASPCSPQTADAIIDLPKRHPVLRHDAHPPPRAQPH